MKTVMARATPGRCDGDRHIDWPTGTAVEAVVFYTSLIGAIIWPRIRATMAGP